jgi:hypothetical protein
MRIIDRVARGSRGGHTSGPCPRVARGPQGGTRGGRPHATPTGSGLAAERAGHTKTGQDARAASASTAPGSRLRARVPLLPEASS